MRRGVAFWRDTNEWAVSDPVVAEGVTVTVVVDMAAGTGVFHNQDGEVLKRVYGIGGGAMYPAAAFREVGTSVTFV